MMMNNCVLIIVISYLFVYGSDASRDRRNSGDSAEEALLLELLEIAGELEERLETVASDVETITTQIQKISVNTGQIGANTAQITNNTRAISANADEIARKCRQIANLTRQVSDNSQRIDDNEEAIESNTERFTNILSTLNTTLTRFFKELFSASILPPFTALNYAICTGRPTPVSGVVGSTNSSDLRCGPNSDAIIGPNGELDIQNGTSDTGADILGTGIGPGPFFSTQRFPPSGFTSFTIEDCEDQCIATEECLAYNWIHVDGDINCELYDSDIPDNFVPNAVFAPDAIILCKPNEDASCTLGEVITWSGDYRLLPSLYVPTDGRQVSEDEFPGICDILGTTYGDDGDGDDTTCLVPNLNGQFIAGTGDIGGNTFALGETGGSASLISSVPTGDIGGGGEVF